MTTEPINPYDKTEKFAIVALLAGIVIVNLFLVYLAVKQDDVIVASYEEEAR